MDREKFTESKENNERRREVSSKFVKMGKALIMEGKESDDFCILSAGNLLILMSGLVLNAKDMYEFNNLCSMFTAKNILDDLMKSPMGGMMRNGLMDKLSGQMGPDMDEINDLLKHLKDSDNPFGIDEDDSEEEDD